jgi:hypothetical protein
VLPVLVEYCTMLDDPRIARRRAEYAARNRETPTEREIARLVEAGKIPDPRRFSLESNCPTGPREPDAGASGVAAAGSGAR